MRKLNILSCVTNELRYWWETAIYLNNLTELGYSNIHILIYVEENTTLLSKWEELQQKFPNVKFVSFEDKSNITKIGRAFKYKPVYRFWLLQEYWKMHPELKDEAVFYTDTDIVLTKYLDFSPFLNDDISYISWTGDKDRTDNYLWQPYFDGKIDQINPTKLEQYKKLDVIGRMAFVCNTTREHITANNLNTGGAQYLLKNVSSQFWTNCFNTCCEIKTFLADVNSIFMKGKDSTEKENNGFQSFCSDMWALLYNLWGEGKETRCPKELDFSWSTDRLDRWNECYIMHNAGIIAEQQNKIAFENDYVSSKLFFKGKYHNFTPFDDEETLNEIINSPISSQFCNAEYVKQILKTKKYLYGGDL